jgi:hypothetical protein
VTNGQIGAVIKHAPASVRTTLAQAATTSFVDALNHIIVIATVVALVSGVLCLFLIRAKDFNVQNGAGAAAGDDTGRDTGRDTTKPGRHKAGVPV